MASSYYHKVELCGVNTAKLKHLTAEEKRVLLEKSSAGDKEARQALIDGNLRLVLSIVQRFSGRGENMDDLFAYIENPPQKQRNVQDLKDG